MTVKTRLVVECDECDEADVTTDLEHERGTEQYHRVWDAHLILVKEHREETGHDPDLTVIENP